MIDYMYYVDCVFQLFISISSIKHLVKQLKIVVEHISIIYDTF